MGQAKINTVPGHERPDFRKAYGRVLLIAAMGTVFFMAHHPTSATELSGIPGMVHGMMLIMLLALATGFVHFSVALGLQHPLVLSGLVCYLAAGAGNGLAALVNGFVVPALAARSEDVITHDIFDFAWVLNQSLAKLAVIGSGAAYLLWSLQLLRTENRRPWLGGLGLVAGIVPAVALLSGRFTMDVPTAFAIYSTQVVWAACVGVAMVRQGR